MLFKKMVLFAIIAIFKHYAFCDVFKKVKFRRKRKPITNIPKPNTMVYSKISAMLPEVQGE